MNNKKIQKLITYQSIIIGLGLLILNVILDMGIMTLPIVQITPILMWVVRVLSTICLAVGLGLITGIISNKISLSNIDDLYSGIDKTQQEKILKALIPQSDNNDFYTYQESMISKCLNLEQHYKTNVIYNVDVSIENGIVIAKTTMSCKEYRLTNDFDKIQVKFDSIQSHIEQIKFSVPDKPNKSQTIEQLNIKNQPLNLMAQI